MDQEQDCSRHTAQDQSRGRLVDSDDDVEQHQLRMYERHHGSDQKPKDDGVRGHVRLHGQRPADGELRRVNQSDVRGLVPIGTGHPAADNYLVSLPRDGVSWVHAKRPDTELGDCRCRCQN